MNLVCARAVPLPLTGTSHPSSSLSSPAQVNEAVTQHWQLVNNSSRHLLMLSPITASSNSSMAPTLAGSSCEV